MDSIYSEPRYTWKRFLTFVFEGLEYSKGEKQ